MGFSLSFPAKLPAVAVIFAAVMTLCIPCSAKLSSTKAQESAMVAIALRVSDRVFQCLNDAYGKQEDYAVETADLAKDIGGYEGGILNDMAVASDFAKLLVFSQYKDTKFFMVIDDFDRAADQLGPLDRKRYYMAKARLRSGRAVPHIESVTRDCFSCLSIDCRRAARWGGDGDKCAGFARAFAEKNGLQNRYLEESLCRIAQESARYFTSEVYRLSRSGDRAKTVKLALQGIKEIGPLTVIADTDGCTRWKSEGVLLARYDSLFVRPLCAAAANKAADEIRLEVVDRYWQYRPLVSAVLPRVTTPSSGAFSLFKKAGKDDVLRHDGRIAVAEVLLWKKAKKLKEFKLDFPERYALAKRSMNTKKRR